MLYEALGKDGSRIKPIDAASMPPLLASATVAAEDRRFYRHAGVDPIALLRAARHDLVEGRLVEGGSTITQQTAKLLLQRRDGVRSRAIGAKAREMVLALRLEHRFSKREILALYLNLAAYGNQTAGAARASDVYFGVDPAMLTPAQAAFLAALPQRPTAFNPWKNAASARNRQLAVINRMADGRMLTAEQVREARDERLALRPRVNPFGAPHFVESGWRSLPPTRGRQRIETTIDLDLQQDVEGIIDHERPSLKAHGAANVAVVVLDNHRGEWLAWEGSGAYSDTDHGGAINGPVVPRQPGSALKPFTYALAFERGRTPATVLPDIPANFPTAEAGVVYSPRNYDGRYRGPLLARTALAGSENVPAVALASDLGVDALLRFLTRAGLSTFDRTPSYYGLGLTLGNAEVRLDELVAAYATFARGGVWIRPSAVPRTDESPRRLVSDADRVLDHRHPERRRRAGLHLRTRKQPRVSVPGGGQDRDVAGVSRQLDDRLHARCHRRRLGGELQSHAAARLVRSDGRWADLPCRDARCAEALRRRRPGGLRDPRASRGTGGSHDLRALGQRAPRRGARLVRANGCRRAPSPPRATGTTRARKASRRCIRRSSAPGPTFAPSRSLR